MYVSFGAQTMKKIITFSNFMVLLGIMTILFYLIPAVHIGVNGQTQYVTDVNLFTATFGGPFTMKYPVAQTFALQANGGLITAFILGILAIIATALKCKFKFATLIAFPFYVASGVLVACTAGLVTSSNYDILPTHFNYSILGGAITVATFFCILAFFALVDFVSTIAKPKQQQPAY